MIRKRKRHGSTSVGRQARALHEAFLTAIRSGRATRGQFDRWHAQHRTSGRGLVVTLREVKPRLTPRLSALGKARRP